LDAALVDDKSGRIIFMDNQVIAKMLPHPFFGTEKNVFTPEGVEYVVLSIFLAQFVLEAGQV